MKSGGNLIRNRPRHFDINLGGWLFADLLLVLSIVVLGGSAVAADVHLTGLPSRTHSKKTSVAPPATGPRPSPARQGLDPSPVKVSLPVDTSRVLRHDSAELKRIRAQLAARTASLKGRRAALVLTFGCDPSPGVGDELAHTTNGQLLSASRALFAGAVTRDFIRLSASNRIDLEIYLFVT